MQFIPVLGTGGGHSVHNNPWASQPTQSIQELKRKEVRGHITFSQGPGSLPAFFQACSEVFQSEVHCGGPTFMAELTVSPIGYFPLLLFLQFLSRFWGVIKLHMQAIFRELCSCRGPWIFSGEQISTFLKLSCLKHAECKNRRWVTMC